MARTMRGCLTAQSQQEGTAVPHNNANFLYLQKQTDAEDSEDVVDNKLDKDYEKEGANPNDEPDAQKMEKEEKI